MQFLAIDVIFSLWSSIENTQKLSQYTKLKGIKRLKMTSMAENGIFYTYYNGLLNKHFCCVINLSLLPEYLF